MNMPFIPLTPDGKQLYNYDTRNLKAKIIMAFWKRFGKKVKYKAFYGELITGEKTVYYGCKFTRCRFENLRLVFIDRCTIEHETPIFNVKNLIMCGLSDCLVKRIPPLIEDKSGISVDEEEA